MTNAINTNNVVLTTTQTEIGERLYTEGTTAINTCLEFFNSFNRDKSLASKGFIQIIKGHKPSFTTGENSIEKTVYDSFRKNFDNWSKADKAAKEAADKEAADKALEEVKTAQRAKMTEKQIKAADKAADKAAKEAADKAAKEAAETRFNAIIAECKGNPLLSEMLHRHFSIA